MGESLRIGPVACRALVVNKDDFDEIATAYPSLASFLRGASKNTTSLGTRMGMDKQKTTRCPCLQHTNLGKQMNKTGTGKEGGNKSCPCQSSAVREARGLADGWGGVRV